MQRATRFAVITIVGMFVSTAAWAEKMPLNAKASQVQFMGTGKDRKHVGRFTGVSGFVENEQGHIEVTIDMNSVVADDDKLTQHLKSPDFFDVRKFPTARFVSKAIKADKKYDSTHVAEGDLTIHGVTKPLVVPINIRWDGQALNVTGAFKILRSQFGMNYGQGQIDDQVQIQFLLAATRPGQQNPVAPSKQMRITHKSSTVLFVGSKNDGKHAGGFEYFFGTFDAGKGKIELTIDLNSIYTDNDKLTQHLKSPDFFDVRKHPRAIFVSKKIHVDKRFGTTHVIVGRLSLHGVERDLQIPANIAWQGKSINIQGNVVIRRGEFGMNYGQGQIADEVPVKFDITAVPE